MTAFSDKVVKAYRNKLGDGNHIMVLTAETKGGKTQAGGWKPHHGLMAERKYCTYAIFNTANKKLLAGLKGNREFHDKNSCI